MDVKRKDLHGQACAEGRRGTRPQDVLVGRCDATGLEAVCVVVSFIFFFFPDSPCWDMLRDGRKKQPEAM